MRVICFTDFIEECGGVDRAQKAIAQSCPDLELEDSSDDCATLPTVADLIRLVEEEGKRAA
ncbi:hypothetical protein AYO40_06940 [Planctomycetaceae bacterium SCGC AG-212-D15]|nr:hypothetical protein AYO40_06940 [Planctomycetaceae bacterium SCGC AG-212-D15]